MSEFRVRSEIDYPIDRGLFRAADDSACRCRLKRLGDLGKHRKVAGSRGAELLVPRDAGGSCAVNSSASSMDSRLWFSKPSRETRESRDGSGRGYKNQEGVARACEALAKLWGE